LDPKTIAITRPVGRGSDTAELVKSLGWTPFIFHTVELKPLDEQMVLDQIQSCLTQDRVDWIVFMSSTGVKLLFDIITSHPNLPRIPPKTRFLAVGPRTRDSLIRYGITQTTVPEEYSSAGVDEWFSQLDRKNLHIALIRSSSADASLANSLVSQGATVATVNIYDSGMPTDPRSVFDFLEGLRLGRFAAVLFTSAVSVSNFFRMVETQVESTEVVRRLRRVTVGAIGPITAQQLLKVGVEPIVPDAYLMKNAVEQLINARALVRAS